MVRHNRDEFSRCRIIQHFVVTIIRNDPLGCFTDHQFCRESGPLQCWPHKISDFDPAVIAAMKKMETTLDAINVCAPTVHHINEGSVVSY